MNDKTNFARNFIGFAHRAILHNVKIELGF
jgi:hypothetical protein